jgi:hypothetical protein
MNPAPVAPAPVASAPLAPAPMGPGSITFAGTGRGQIDGTGVAGFFGNGQTNFDGQGSGVFFGNGNAAFDGRGQVNLFAPPQGPAVGMFNNFDGSVNFAGNGGAVAFGTGQTNFDGTGFGFSAGVGNAQWDGVGQVNVNAARAPRFILPGFPMPPPMPMPVAQMYGPLRTFLIDSMDQYQNQYIPALRKTATQLAGQFANDKVDKLDAGVNLAKTIVETTKPI